MEEIQISTPLVWRETKVERILIGKVLFNKTYTRTALESILRKAWNLPEGFDVIELNGNAFMFKFADVEEFNRILRGRPWSINGFLLNLMERSKFKACEDFDFSKCPVWIQMHNVPMEAWCLENAVIVGGYVGEVLLAEDPYYNGRFLRSFLRARVLLDLKKPLAYGFWMPRPDGKKVWISIRYEKLQCFCYNCGRIGHDNWSCRQEKLLSIANPEEPRFGAWLTTNACRSYDEVLVVICNDWSESIHARRKKEEAIKRQSEQSKRKAEQAQRSNDDDLFVIKLNKSQVGKSGLEQVEGKDRREAKGVEMLKQDRGHVASFTRDNVTAQSDLKERGRQATGSEEEDLVAVDKANREGLVDRSSKANGNEEGVQMAMVVYERKVLGDIINKIEDLGLKRNVAEEWETSKAKRLKVEKTTKECKPEISTYTDNLKKSKVKARRNIKRKGRGLSVERLEEAMEVENERELAAEESAMVSGFVFKAGRGRRAKFATEGEGGWPLTATELL
ncbi:hypothetical protein QN277_013478 [Acacia crassicarpa]|uniref:CCHC-type domain-containing protein n=1 Tax=Acacia crassicarpa TaxID=499986 RepID=A0AAE1N3B2_9FABA|nr:hypothetical protein QN277_013478 [Acacia crassicarpa]